MSFIVPDDLRFPTPTSKSHLEHCGKFFCTNLEKTFLDTAKKTVILLDNKIKVTSAFNEKQVLHDLKKKLSLETGKLVAVFRQKIEIELNNQLSLDYRLHGKPIWWRNLCNTNKEELSYKEYLLKIEDALGNGFKQENEDLNKRINCITGVEQEIFGSNVIMKSIVSTLKETIVSPVSLYYGVIFFVSTWSNDIVKILASMNTYLAENNVVPIISDYDDIFRGIKQLPKSWGWEKEGTYVDKETASRTTVYGSMAVPVNLELPSLNDFLSGKTTKIEEHIAVPRFEPKDKAEIAQDIIEPQVAVEQININISNIIENIQETSSDVIGEQEKNIFSWTDYVIKIERILKIQEKNNKDINPLTINFSEVRNYEIKSTDSLLAKDEDFIEISTNLQKKIRRIDFFQDNEETLNTSLFEDFLSNSELESKMSDFDRYVCNFLDMVFSKIISNSNITLLSKSLFYKLQIPLWHKIISDKGFFTTKDNATRILLEILLSNELVYNLALLEKVEDLVSSTKYRYRNVSSYFNGLIDEILIIIESQNNKEDNLLKDVTEEYKEVTNKSEVYRLILKSIKSNIDKTTYEPVRVLIEKIWARAFVNKYYNSININFTTTEALLRNLSISAKLNWQQSMVAFETISLIANNSENTPTKISKMKELLSKANSILPKIFIELNVDTNYTKALLSLLKYKIDSYSKTSNEVMLEELMSKIKPNEDMFIKATEEYSKSLSDNHQIKIDTNDMVNPLKLPCALNQWYLIMNEHMKLKYTTNDNEFLFFMLSKDTFSTESFTKSKVNSLFKEREAHLLGNYFACGSFSAIMLNVSKEIIEKL